MSKLQELRAKIDSREARIGVIGLGYVGLPLAVELGQAGFRVTGFDVDGTKIRSLAQGHSYIGDVESADLVEQIDAGHFEATDDFDTLAEVDIINICVPTPLRKTRDPDVSFIASAVEEIRKHLHEGQLIILGSTTYPGTTHEFVIPLLEGSGLVIGTDFSLAFAPERIDPGNTQFKVQNVPKVVGGETALCTDLACAVDAIDGFPAALKHHVLHLLASHHGLHEHGAPVRPATREALALHYADDLDSKMGAMDIAIDEAEATGADTAYSRSLGRRILRRSWNDVED